MTAYNVRMCLDNGNSLNSVGRLICSLLRHVQKQELQPVD
jgi:hypothetical protein